ncbi:MAG: transposase [Armatimonadota bacterium]|nr:MAG: transposase [Armatimonadota bacterium]
MQHRFGALGRHGSISVTERVIRTLKQKWLRRVALIRGMDHLAQLLDDFATYYNEWRPHMRLEGATPDSAWCGRPWMAPGRSHKEVPVHIEQRLFSEVHVTAYRLPRVT